MSNFLKTQNLTFHRSLSSPSAMSDSSSQNLVVLADVGTAACASGWTRYDLTGMCYQQSKKTMNWYQGEDYCWNLRPGAHSASVHSQEEAKWLNCMSLTFVCHTHQSQISKRLCIHWKICISLITNLKSIIHFFQHQFQSTNE